MAQPNGRSGQDDDANVPARTLREFPGISSRAWEHPADRAALSALRSVPGFDTFLKTMAGVFSERRMRALYLANAVRTSELQFRGVHRLHVDCVRVMDVGWEPELYVIQNPMVNAMTFGLDKPFIVLNTELVDLLDDEELRFVIGHEIGHVLSGHALYTSVLANLMQIVGAAGLLALPALALRAIIEALLEWFRKAEVSCDRAGLLAGQEPGAAMRTHMKLAGGARLSEMHLPAFLDQGEEYLNTGDVRDSVIRLLNMLGTRHPFPVARAQELKRWIETGDYARILSGEYPHRDSDKDVKVSEELRAAIKNYRDNFEASQDPLTKLARDVSETAATAGGWLSDRLRGGRGANDR